MVPENMNFLIRNLTDFENLSKDDPDFPEKCLKVVEDINNGSYTFLTLVEQLKGFLIDSVPTKRELGMCILTQVLENISYDQISLSQLDHVCDFYAQRLKDHHQVIPPTLRGILVLATVNHLPEGRMRDLLHFIFNCVPCQQQQQHDRLNIYNIFQISLDNHFQELQGMGFDFIYGVISAIDGERDPRNLLFLFNWLPKLLKEFTLRHLSEEMFEVLACYFPVDFRTPPPQESNSINRQALASALSNCLCATTEFAEYCLPLALEKLSSSLSIAKFDSLDILIKGCNTFSLPFYIHHATDIWSQIQREVLNNNNEELEKLALQAFVVVMNKLSQNPDNIFKPILADIIDTLKGNLLPNMKLFLRSCKMLHHLCKSSKTAATFVVNQVIPLMVNTYHITMTPSHQILILNNLVYFICVYTEVHQNNDITENSHLLLVPCLCLDASLNGNDELRAAGLQCTSIIAKSLTLDVRMCFYKNMCSLLLLEQPNLIRHSLLELFKCLAEVYSDEVQIYILNQIQINNNDALNCYLQSLTKIVGIRSFTYYILQIFFKHCRSDLDTAFIGIDRLRQLLEQYVDNEQIQLYLGETLQIVSELIDLVLNHINIVDVGNSNHRQLLGNIATICKLILPRQNKESQLLIMSKCEKVIASYRKDQNVGLVVIIDGLISCLHKDIQLQSHIVLDLLQVSLHCDYEFVVVISNQLLANILNKNVNDEKLVNDLKLLEAYLNENQNGNQVDRIINISSWIAKALLMRGHISATYWTKKLVELLEEHQEAAKGFEVIMKNKCPTLSEESFCNIKFLYRQKFFMEITSLLSQNYKDSNTNYLLAIGYILKDAPRQIIIMEFKKIIKMVLLCLEKCENWEILLVVLETLSDLIKNKETVIEEYLQEILSRIIGLTLFKSSMMIRIRALECIQYFAVDYPIYKLLPFKQDVIHKLTFCLDDKKRLVRKAAVEAKLSWIMLDALI